MKIFGWIQVVFGLFAIGAGAIVLRGVRRETLSGNRVTRFLEFSLIASLAGLLPLTGHLSPIQGVCMLSVYCTGVAILAWRRFHLDGLWRPAFAFLIVAVLYLNAVSVSIGLSNHSPLFAMSATGADSQFELAQFLLASAFAVLGVLAVRKSHAQRAWPAPQTLCHRVKR